jgi:hypothetical protein
MDPITMAAFAAASLFVSVRNNASQAKIEKANIKMQVEQTRLQASELAYERSKAFRKNVSEQLALSGLGVGGMMGFGNVYNESLRNYTQDVEAIQRKAQFAQLTGMANTSLSSAKKFNNDITSVVSAANLASDLGLFKQKDIKPIKRSGF